MRSLRWPALPDHMRRNVRKRGNTCACDDGAGSVTAPKSSGVTVGVRNIRTPRPLTLLRVLWVLWVLRVLRVLRSTSLWYKGRGVYARVD